MKRVDTLILLLLAHLIIPIVLGCAFMILSYMTGPSDALGSELVIEAAVDLAILSLGAIIPIFEHPGIQAFIKSRESVIVIALGLVAVNLFLTILVFLFRRDIYAMPKRSVGRKRFCAGCGFFCGALAIGCICLPVAYALKHPSATFLF